MHKLYDVHGATLAAEHFGDPSAPLLLCIGSPTMLSWPDALCESLAEAGRHVVRFDLRDAGASTTVDPDNPQYTLRDLAADAAALASAIDDRPAYLAGIGVSGMVAQVAAIEHPSSFAGLILYGTRPVAPGPVDDDLPDHDGPTMERLFPCPCRTGPTARRWLITLLKVPRFSAMTPLPHAKPPHVSGTAPKALILPFTWLIRWAWCSLKSTARRAGGSAFLS